VELEKKATRKKPAKEQDKNLLFMVLNLGGETTNFSLRL
jgi:hypothetical protein